MDDLVRSVARRWRTLAWLRGALAATAVLAAGATALLLADALFDLPAAWRAWTRWVPLLAAAVPLVLAARQAARVAEPRTAALLVDASDPDLAHLVTTLLEADLSGPVGAALRRRAATRVAGVSPRRVVPWTGRREVAGAAMGVAAVAVLLATAAGGAGGVAARWFGPDVSIPPRAAADGAASPDGAGAVVAFGSASVTLAPPAYSGLTDRTVPLAGVVEALPGSRVQVRVAATGGVLDARRLGGGEVAVDADAEGWTATWTVTPSDRGLDLALADAGGAVVDRRVLALAVREDRPPDVVLELPAADQVLATAAGRMPVRARVTDDFGVEGWALHWVRSSGSGESFSFDEGSWAWEATDVRGDTLVGTFSLDVAGAGLGPGDVLHLRAEAVDRNDVTGPGRGVSATRMLRIATDEQMAEVTTLVGFPIEREREPLLSQRMILLLTEELLAARDSLHAEAFRERANGIADEQDRLRDRVGEIMFLREGGADEPSAAPGDPAAPPQPLEPPGHDHDGAAILDVNLDLVSAFNAMWEASRHLRQAEVAASVPPQETALEHLQRLREGERVFARGRVTRPPLDLEAARGTGEVDEAAPAPRSPGRAAPDGSRWLGALEAALGDAAGDGPGADPAAALRLRELAAAMLSASDGSVEAAGSVATAADAADAGDRAAARAAVAEAARLLAGGRARGSASPPATARDGVGAAYLARLAQRDADEEPAAAAAERPEDEPAPFVFATARYGSGDWDSAPLVPSNLAHSLAQYTSLPVDSEGAVVDLGSPDLFRYPFLFLTGHLPLRLDEAETEGLRTYVERGGFVFIDDHNHDIDGAFHRSVVSELGRIFGTDALQPLPNDHELYGSFFVFDEGPPITGHELSGWGDGLIHRELFAVEVGGRIGVLYSNKDYASEWSYHAENKRFLALDNTRFGVNVLIYALTR
ncbi:MAG: DUF4159 domain-containing protein [Longimicrobiales bacterium]